LKKAARVPIPQVSLETRSASTLQRQLRDGLRALILHGPIARGVRLPSSRTLALKLGVSRNTVLFAYEELATEQVLTGQIGSGTRVACEATTARFTDPDGQAIYLVGVLRR
jgi:GntR family transcriptional regulator / MocR family aminotransferase